MEKVTKLTQYSQLGMRTTKYMKTCSLCAKSSEDEGLSLIHFGEWMFKKEITVHYFCLLLSTNLPQRGEDHGGILGFLLRDIRLEIAKAKNRKCMYCLEPSATIQCAKCKKYFHLPCGHTSKCLTQFVGEFKSYCHACLPVDQYKMDLLSHKALKSTELCFICTQQLEPSPDRWIYAKCCGNGFTHSKCMKIYALSAGYYLTCIWCKDKRFREDIKYLGIFVPDREAKWEKEKGAYVDLYRGHKRCDMEVCNCPKGRDYTSAKWQLINCKLCGAFGSHNPACIPGFEDSKKKLPEFKCDVCSVTEKTVLHKNVLEPAQDLIDVSLYVTKDAMAECELATSKNCNSNSVIDNVLSQETIVNVNRNSTADIQLSSTVYTLTQSPQPSQQSTAAVCDLSKIKHKKDSESDGVIVDILVQKVLDAFELSL